MLGIQFDTGGPFSVLNDTSSNYLSGHCPIMEEGISLEQDLPTRPMDALERQTQRKMLSENWYGWKSTEPDNKKIYYG